MQHEHNPGQNGNIRTETEPVNSRAGQSVARDLSSYLIRNGDKVVWEDMQLGPSGSPRPDVYCVNKSFTKFCPVSYEVKVHYSDFRGDVTSGKWQSYLKFSQAVIFAAPKGLINKDELPSNCGLILRSETGWRVAKRPVLNHVNIPATVYQKLIIDGVERFTDINKPKYFNEWVELDRRKKYIGERFGKVISDIVYDIETAENRLSQTLRNAKWQEENEIQKHNVYMEHLKKKHQEEIEFLKKTFDHNKSEFQNYKKELCDILNLEYNTSEFVISNKINDVKRELTESFILQDAQVRLKSMERNFNTIKNNFEETVKWFGGKIGN